MLHSMFCVQMPRVADIAHKSHRAALHQLSLAHSLTLQKALARTKSRSSPRMFSALSAQLVRTRGLQHLTTPYYVINEK